MRLTVGLPTNSGLDAEFRCAIALYTSDIEIRQRTLVAHVADAHDLSMVVDSLQSERLLERVRWINCNTQETHP